MDIDEFDPELANAEMKARDEGLTTGKTHTQLQKEESDAFYLNRDPMFAYVKSPDIIEIYKRIKSALLNKGPEICAQFGYVYQLNLVPPIER